ncbi:related to MUC1 Extracellular alpha-1,4-glucan glucosidase [Rhynchosporium secalis]|uniref:Related to MUC1 Extracellular alpha-1,4-glucan glucosidase n=1 Tax=Rhynchosporium secalis TaxID=38038 RepID=A0A1E1M1V5_RHYSE|nr:related to MUC1 Extracellular alpha-1,4-glucan glucosidase [Rhynchosporium secalis]
MSTAVPQVPPRPARTTQQDQSAGAGNTLGSDLPKIPPRPVNRRLDRSMSPSRESFARSPLNESPYHANHSKTSLHSSENLSTSDLPRRPPSVSLPSIGQEGNEYADYSIPAEEQLGTSPTQTRNIANDLKLHAPKPSLPVSSAKARVSTVTRTDSGQAASFGIGKAQGDDKEPSARSLKAKASFASQTSVGGTERPPSSAESEHGIPEIGQRVPMYPNAGDVQAPSPSPFAQPYAPGIGFHNDGSKPRNHGRKLSSRGHDIPPDAYGRYGHGVIPHDRFEKAYYEKHPELFKKELGQYGEGRPEWAMSSDDLNKIVRDTASRGAGSGSRNLISTPSEQIGIQASEEYASRMSSPRPQSGYYVSHSNASDTHVDSPLKKEALAAEPPSKHEFESTLSRSLQAPSDNALESEVEDDVIHVDAPGKHSKRIYRTDYAESTEELERQFSHGAEENYGAPILASDEVAKEPFGWDLEPAVSPLNERRRSSHDEGGLHFRTGSASSANNSRPSSRPGSIHGVMPGLRGTGAPLEDLDEYEPLFPEEEQNGSKEKPLTAADRLKRPELKNRKFPSQDIWEDTPNSLQYTATVSTPQLPEEQDLDSKNTPEQENSAHAFARRQEELAEKESKSPDSFLHQEKKPWVHKAHLAAESRPDLKQRFPSRDVWEDTPDSLQLQTTVGSLQIDETDLMSPMDEGQAASPINIASISKPQVPARPGKSKLSESPEKAQPAIPERPRPKQGDATSSPVPVKAKPQVPARPAKPITRESTENVPLTTVLSNSSARSVGSDQGAAAATKPKPPVPSRPMGSKIAALQGGFMSDLNKRLQLGPQAPKKEESAPEEEEEIKDKAPLLDARKGRARGPARRAPGKSPAPAASGSTSTLSFSLPSTLWEVDPEEDYVMVGSYEDESVPASVETKAAQSETPTLATNTAGIPVHEPSEIAPDAEKASSSQSFVEGYHASQAEDAQRSLLIAQGQSDKNIKAPDEPYIVQASDDESKASLAVPEEEEDLSASTTTLKPNEENVAEKEDVKENLV